mmetsp:Transcript_1080/g.1653  ORF Transcript_1080/g.1653 Transcript_1080/m.1653 type:complete len:482 (+) Transcript_1080:47-1492(+)
MKKCSSAAAHYDRMDDKKRKHQEHLSDKESHALNLQGSCCACFTQICEVNKEIMHLRSILSSLPCIVFGLDQRGTFTLRDGKGVGQYGIKACGGNDAARAEDVRKVRSGELKRTITIVEGRFYETTFEPVQSVDGQDVPSTVCGITVDVTPLKLAERQGIESQLKTFWIVRFSIEGEILFVGPNATMYHGWEPEELIGKNAEILTHPDDIISQREIFNRLLSVNEEKDVEIKVRVRHKDGHYIWVRGISNLIRDTTGKPTEIVNLVWDITEEIERERKLKDAIEAANSANKLKSEFLAVVSHELRTPLNSMCVCVCLYVCSILGFTTVLSDTSLDSTQREFVDNIQNSAQALMCLLSDVLDFSRLEAGRVEMHNEVFDIRVCVEEALSILAPAAAEKRLMLASVIDPQLPPMVCGDNNRIRQIILNLLSNGHSSFSRIAFGLYLLMHTMIQSEIHSIWPSVHYADWSSMHTLSKRKRLNCL